jgi:hypothetical protein
MRERSLQVRLKRLKRETAQQAGGPEGSLERVERTLLGQVDDEVPLKERLERLIAATTSRSRERTARLAEVGPRASHGTPFEGREVVNERGTCLLVEKEVLFGSAASHAGASSIDTARAWLEQLRYADPDAVAVLTGSPNFAEFDYSRAVFLDTETTGLSGGTGTAAFLIGVGSLEGDSFQVRQYLMRDYNEEPALLEALARDISRFEYLVTYNGRQFDVPLLETRYRLDRQQSPLLRFLHLDLLHPARRLWKRRFDSCRLQSLEAALLGVKRVGDIPGEEIPDIYFRFIRGQDESSLGRILEHNFIDIVSLAALAARAGHWVTDECVDDPRDAFSLARVFERAQQVGRAIDAYERALAMGAGALHVPTLLSLGGHAKRRGDHDAAVPYWREAADAGACLAFRELAIHHERRQRDPSAALAIVDDGLERIGTRPCCRRTLQDFERRRSRLIRRVERARLGGSAATGSSGTR